jgi:hypothetical protein
MFDRRTLLPPSHSRAAAKFYGFTAKRRRKLDLDSGLIDVIEAFQCLRSEN